MKIDPHRPRSAHTIPPLRLDLGTDCARTRWRHHAPPRLSHAQGPCACDYAIGFFRRPPCRPQSVPRVLSNNACERPIFTGAEPPPNSATPTRGGTLVVNVSDYCILIRAYARFGLVAGIHISHTTIAPNRTGYIPHTPNRVGPDMDYVWSGDRRHTPKKPARSYNC